jgi:AcrR family transcriptional regulator
MTTKTSAKPKAGRNKPSYDETHQRILDATIDSIGTLGLSSTTVQTIADLAHVSTATVIKHFKTKEGVLEAVIEMLALDFERERRRVTEAAEGDAVTCLRLLVDLSFDAKLSSDRYIRAWYAYSGEVTAQSVFERHMGPVDQAFERQVKSLFRHLARSGGKMAVDADALAIGFIGTLEWLWQNRLLRRQQSRPAGAKKVMLSYLASVLPAHFGASAGRTHK